MFTRPSMFGPPAMFRAPGMFTGEAAEATGVESEWCVSCDGVNDFVDAESSPRPSSSFTISWWAKRNGVTATYQTMLGFYGAAYSNAMNIQANLTGSGASANSLAVYVRSSSNVVVCNASSLFSLSDNEWHHFAITVSVSGSSATTTIFADGSQVATATASFSGSLLSASSRFTVGAFPSGASSAQEFFNGRIDDIRIYNRALSSTEVTALYENTSPTTDGLVAYLPLEEGTGTTTAIKNGSGATIGTATLTNGPTWSSSVPAALAP